jgi:hypothetical protein
MKKKKLSNEQNTHCIIHPKNTSNIRGGRPSKEGRLCLNECIHLFCSIDNSGIIKKIKKKLRYLYTQNS